MATVLLLLLGLSIIGNVLVQPTTATADEPYKAEHCIKMNSRTEREIQEIVSKIGELLTDLMQQHHEYDIRLVRFDVERHSDDEVEEKDTVLQLTINDCAAQDDDEEILDEEEAEDVEVMEDTQVTPKVTPEVINLTFDEPGQQLLTLLEKRRSKKPIFVYIEKEKDGNTNYAFLKKK